MKFVKRIFDYKKNYNIILLIYFVKYFKEFNQKDKKNFLEIYIIKLFRIKNHHLNWIIL